MRDDFCALILTHGRPDNIQTLAALKRFGYTGAVYLVVDDEDAALPAYRAKFGDMVVAFSKAEIEPSIDLCDGSESKKAISAKRKAMNVFVCDTGRPFRYVARMNDDVTTYVNLQRRGLPFLTFLAAQVNQAETQSRAGGLTEMYEQFGTYVKSFYSVMFDPSCVRVASLGDPRVGGAGYKRLHHLIDWNAAAPCIIEERYRKAA